MPRSSCTWMACRIRRWAASGTSSWRCRPRPLARPGGASASCTCTTARTSSIPTPALPATGSWARPSRITPALGTHFIVVAVYNGRERRLAEYTPFEDTVRGGGAADEYLAFLADTLKPLVDGRFPTLPGREFTSIAGSSLGGLLSIYAHFRRPDVFGASAVMSPSLWFADGAIHQYITDAAAVGGRIYLDVGSRGGSG